MYQIDSTVQAELAAMDRRYGTDNQPEGVQPAAQFDAETNRAAMAGVVDLGNILVHVNVPSARRISTTPAASR